jgi:hypothetical protein
MSAGLKHFAAYSVETGRPSFNANITDFDLHDSYFRAFHAGVVEGQASLIMCSYASINGVPSCANPLLTTLVRDTWASPDVVVVRDAVSVPPSLFRCARDSTLCSCVRRRTAALSRKWRTTTTTPST